MLHDLGLTPTADPQPCHCCFAVGGGVHARNFLLGKGFCRRHADVVGHAVAVHLNYHVPHEEHGDTAFLVILLVENSVTTALFPPILLTVIPLY